MTPRGQLSSPSIDRLKSAGQPCISARVQQNNFSELSVSKEVNK